MTNISALHWQGKIKKNIFINSCYPPLLRIRAHLYFPGPALGADGGTGPLPLT
jgi:hypothetical protein